MFLLGSTDGSAGYAVEAMMGDTHLQTPNESQGLIYIIVVITIIEFMRSFFSK